MRPLRSKALAEYIKIFLLIFLNDSESSDLRSAGSSDAKKNFSPDVNLVSAAVSSHFIKSMEIMSE